MKICLVFLIVIFLQYTSAAQSISVTPIVGANFSTVRATPNQFSGSGSSQRASLKTSWQAGALIEIEATKRWSFLSGLSYSNKGFTYKSGGFLTGALSITPYTFSYLEMPVISRLNLGTSNTRFFIETGVYTAYWLRYNVNSTSPLVANGNIPLKNNFYQRQDYGLIAGFGLKQKAGPGSLILTARYSHGFRSIFNHKNLPEWYNPVRNRVGSLLLGYSIPIN